MKLFNKISPKISSIILLFSFLGIYVINIGCSIGNIAEDFKWFSQVEEKHDHGSHDHGDHSHGDGHHHGTDSDKKSQDEEDDGCCDDEASTFFASVQSAPVHQVKYNFTPTQISILSVVVLDIFDFNLSSEFFIDNRPPPDILPRFPDIRIAIQSFQI